MKALKPDSQIEGLHCLKNRMRRVKLVAAPVLASICLTSVLALPGYGGGQQVFQQATTPPAANSVWTFTGSLNKNRYGHTATLLASGKVLVVGGMGIECSGSLPYRSCSSIVNDTAELFDPATEVWSFTGSLNPRAFHSATLLENGQLLVAGGGISHSPLDSAELYDPTTGKWRPTGSFSTIRGQNTATLLPNGKVLVVGVSDHTDRGSVYGAELYDPATETWAGTGAPTIGGPLTLLPNGKVLNVSGNSAELFDPGTEKWSSTGKPNVIRYAGTVTLLGNGRVLVTGWTSEDGAPGAELYDPDIEAWSITGSPNTVGGTATLLTDGRVLLAGGYHSGYAPNGEDLYDPDEGTWSLTPPLNTAPRDAHTATLLEEGKVLVAGGVDYEFSQVPLSHSSTELYAPIAIPRITGASVSGKRLFVSGEAFKRGAVILLNGEEQKTRNDNQTPRTMLIGKNAGRKIKPGDRLQVRNPGGSLSEEFTFTGS